MTRKSHIFSALQFGSSLMVTSILWLGSLGVVLSIMIKAMQSDNALMDMLPGLVLGGSGFISGVLFLPSAYYGLRRVTGKSPAGQISIDLRGWQFWLIAAMFPLALLLGEVALNNKGLAILLMPALHILAVGIPVFGITYLAVQKLPLGSPQRFWGVLNSGMALGPFLVMILEALSLIFIALLIIFYASTKPDWLKELFGLAQKMQLQTPTEEHIFESIKPFINSPVVIGLLLSFFAILIPLIEELIKPIGVWLLAGKALTPKAGFAAGAVSGAGFALVETLAVSFSNSDWVSLVSARVGTAGVHIMTSALTGWAIVQLWTKRRYLRFFAALFTSMCIHGLWNGLTVLFSINQLAQMFPLSGLPALLTRVGAYAPPTLALLAGGALLNLFLMNRRLQRSSISKPDSDNHSKT